jgi:hypothetical protein
MTQNPYAGSVFDSSWKSGFDEGFAAPDEDHPAPSPFDHDQQTVFSEGVLSGQEAGHGLPAGDHERTNWVEVIREAGGEGREFIAHVAYDLSFVEGATVGMSVATGVIFAFLKVAIWGPERGPFFEEAAA